MISFTPACTDSCVNGIFILVKRRGRPRKDATAAAAATGSLAGSAAPSPAASLLHAPETPLTTGFLAAEIPTGTLETDSAHCATCLLGHSPPTNRIVLCDGCNAAFHQLCHTPLITEDIVNDSESEWFCRDCEARRVLSDTWSLPSNWEEGVDGAEVKDETRKEWLKGLPHALLVELVQRLCQSASASGGEGRIYPRDLESKLEKEREWRNKAEKENEERRIKQESGAASAATAGTSGNLQGVQGLEQASTSIPTGYSHNQGQQAASLRGEQQQQNQPRQNGAAHPAVSTSSTFDNNDATGDSLSVPVPAQASYGAMQTLNSSNNESDIDADGEVLLPSGPEDELQQQQQQQIHYQHHDHSVPHGNNGGDGNDEKMQHDLEDVPNNLASILGGTDASSIPGIPAIPADNKDGGDVPQYDSNNRDDTDIQINVEDHSMDNNNAPIAESPSSKTEGLAEEGQHASSSSATATTTTLPSYEEMIVNALGSIANPNGTPPKVIYQWMSE